MAELHEYPDIEWSPKEFSRSFTDNVSRDPNTGSNHRMNQTGGAWIRLNNRSFNNLNSGAGNKLIGDSGSKSNSGFKDRLNRDQIIWTETILNQWIQSCGQLKNLVLDKEGKLLEHDYHSNPANMRCSGNIN